MVLSESFVFYKIFKVYNEHKTGCLTACSLVKQTIEIRSLKQ